MTTRPHRPAKKLLAQESGTIRKDWQGRLKIALVYPNAYPVGMSNLGFQTVYALFNAFDHVVCERAFLDDGSGEPAPRPGTLESGHPLTAFDLIAFSIAFENDYANILKILTNSGIPTHANARDDRHPLVAAGGVTCFMNPEPLAPFIDCFFIGEAEGILPSFVARFDPAADRRDLLEQMAHEVRGLYVPSLYTAIYNKDGTLQAFEPLGRAPAKVQRVFIPDLNSPTCTTIMTDQTTFDSTFLVEVSRGCPHGCRFCGAGYVYRPPRFNSADGLAKVIAQGAASTDRIGLVGAAVSDLPGLDRLCRQFHPAASELPIEKDTSSPDVKFSFSSLRADVLTPGLVAELNQSGVKTATLAPDAGSERMRRVINKGITQDHLLSAAAALVDGGIPNLKLYFMVGLPTETDADVAAIVRLVKRIKHVFLKSSRAQKRIGDITVSLNSFIPKPFTPFQWVPMDNVRVLKKKIKHVKTGLKSVPNVRVHSDLPRWAYVQALLARGDRKVARILQAAVNNQGNWPHTFKTSAVNPDFYVLRERQIDETLPWDIIDHGISKDYLAREYARAREGRTSPACQVETCRACGICRPEPPP